MKQLTTSALLVAVFWANVASAHAPYPNPTPRVRVTGMLLPLDAQDRRDHSTLPVFIQGQHRLLRLDTVEELMARERDRTILRELCPRQVRLYAADDLILPLLRPESVGKFLTIEGRLSLRERRLLITAVEDVTEVGPQDH